VLPARTVGAQAAGGHDGVHVGVIFESASPGVKHQRGAEGGVKMSSTEGQQGAPRSGLVHSGTFAQNCLRHLAERLAKVPDGGERRAQPS
jgi:hypothetical protein